MTSSSLRASGQVWSWGDGDYGKLGRGGSNSCKTPFQVERLQGLGVIRTHCGSQFSAAITKDGHLYTWGKGNRWRLGHGTEDQVRFPRLVESLQGVLLILSIVMKIAMIMLHF